jgi:hypothetical protein
LLKRFKISIKSLTLGLLLDSSPVGWGRSENKVYSGCRNQERERERERERESNLE